MFYGVFIAPDTDGAGARAEGDTTLVKIQILMEQETGAEGDDTMVDIQILMEQGTRADGDTPLVDIQILLEAFLNMSLRSACFIKAVFLMVKSKTFDLETTPLRWRIFRLTEVGLKEFCCTFFGFRNI